MNNTDNKPEIRNEEKAVSRSYISQIRRESEDVLSLDGELITTDAVDSLSNTIIELSASKKSKKILTDRIAGVEFMSNHTTAILYHGDFKILIPDDYLVDLSDKNYEVANSIAMSHIISGRLGADTEYIITEIDVDNRIAIGSHLEAAKRRQLQYFGERVPGSRPVVVPGMIVEARVFTVRRFGIFIDVFGAETFIPLRELSYNRLANAADEFSNGDIIQVRITSVEKGENGLFKVTASVKEAMPDPRAKAIKDFNVNGLYNGKVTMIDEYGVFVSLGNGAECKCEFPKDKFPYVGSMVSVRIFSKNETDMLLWGVITRIIK